MFKKLIVFLVFALIFLTVTKARDVSAVSIPDFPSCSNPQGSLKAQFNEGVHGIVGDQSIHTGSDSVYQINDQTLVQCFCPPNGAGIQTNWWKVSSLTQNEIDTLKNLGWVFVPIGSVWGLTDDPYLAINSNYSCNGGTGGEGGSGGSGAGGSSGSSSSSSSSGGQGAAGGEVLGISTSAGEVLGLASTGNILTVYLFLGIGFLALLTGLILKKFSK